MAAKHKNTLVLWVNRGSRAHRLSVNEDRGSIPVSVWRGTFEGLRKKTHMGRKPGSLDHVAIEYGLLLIMHAKHPARGKTAAVAADAKRCLDELSRVQCRPSFMEAGEVHVIEHGNVQLEWVSLTTVMRAWLDTSSWRTMDAGIVKVGCQALETASAARPRPEWLREYLLDVVCEQRRESLASLDRYLASVVGLQGKDMLEAASHIEAFCETHHCVLRRIGESQKEIVRSEFTIRVGPRRKGQKAIVMAVRLDKKTADGTQLQVLPAMRAVAIEELTVRDQETVATRRRAKLLGRRTGGKYFTDEDHVRAGHARAAALSRKERIAIASKAGEASAAYRANKG